MSATPIITAIIVGPLLGVIVAFAAGWPAHTVVLAAMAGEAIAYVGLQLWGRRAADRARARALQAGGAMLATAAVLDVRARISGLVAALVLALGVAGLGLLARRLVVAALR